MMRDKIHDALNLLDDDLIREVDLIRDVTDTRESYYNNRSWVRWVNIAACISLAICSILIVVMLPNVFGKNYSSKNCAPVNTAIGVDLGESDNDNISVESLGTPPTAIGGGIDDDGFEASEYINYNGVTYVMNDRYSGDDDISFIGEKIETLDESENNRPGTSTGVVEGDNVSTNIPDVKDPTDENTQQNVDISALEDGYYSYEGEDTSSKICVKVNGEIYEYVCLETNSNNSDFSIDELLDFRNYSSVSCYNIQEDNAHCTYSISENGSNIILDNVSTGTVVTSRRQHLKNLYCVIFSGKNKSLRMTITEDGYASVYIKNTHIKLDDESYKTILDIVRNK